jgi:hypothetical protein
MGIRADFGKKIIERHIEIQRICTGICCGRRNWDGLSFRALDFLEMLIGSVNNPKFMDRLMQNIKVCS